MTPPLKLFRKFIRFGSVTRSLLTQDFNKLKSNAMAFYEVPVTISLKVPASFTVISLTLSALKFNLGKPRWVRVAVDSELVALASSSRIKMVMTMTMRRERKVKKMLLCWLTCFQDTFSRLPHCHPHPLCTSECSRLSCNCRSHLFLELHFKSCKLRIIIPPVGLIIPTVSLYFP